MAVQRGNVQCACGELVCEELDEVFYIVQIMTCMKLFFNTEIYHFPNNDFIPGGLIIVVYVFTTNDNILYIIIKIKTGVNILFKN